MLNQDFGIILKSFYPAKNKFSIFTKTSGRLDLIFSPNAFRSHFSSGVMLDFYYDVMPNSSNILKKISIEIFPEYKDKCDIEWLHNILEISFYFFPIGLPSVDIFNLLRDCCFFLKNRFLFNNYFNFVKRICWARLFVLNGFSPNKSVTHAFDLYDYIKTENLNKSRTEYIKQLKFFHKLLNMNVEFIIRDIDEWVINCMKECSFFESLKTFSFIKTLKR